MNTILSTVLLKATGYKTVTSSRGRAVHRVERRQPPVSTSVVNVTLGVQSEWTPGERGATLMLRTESVELHRV